jgi:RHS repeat-associated protein
MTDSTGTLISQQRYLPFGQVRTDVSSPNAPATDLAFTGQRNLDAQGNVSLGLMDYNARMYDSLLARFIQPDSIISGFSSPQTWNRYAYVLNNPVNEIDPTGNRNCAEDDYDCNGSGNNSSYEPISGSYTGSVTTQTSVSNSSSGQSGSGTTISSCGNGIISCGSVVTVQRFPTTTLTTFAEIGNNSYTGTSSGGDTYSLPNSFGEMSDKDAIMYAGGAIQVAEDQLTANAPAPVPPPNMVVALDWEYQQSTFSVTAIHVVNYTTNTAYIAGIQVFPSDHSSSMLFGPSDIFGPNGGRPGTMTMNLPGIQYPRNMSIVVGISIKINQLAVPGLSIIPISGTGMQSGISQAPTIWIQRP